MGGEAAGTYKLFNFGQVTHRDVGTVDIPALSILNTSRAVVPFRSGKEVKPLASDSILKQSNGAKVRRGVEFSKRNLKSAYITYKGFQRRCELYLYMIPNSISYPNANII